MSEYNVLKKVRFIADKRNDKANILYSDQTIKRMEKGMWGMTIDPITAGLTVGHFWTKEDMEDFK